MFNHPYELPYLICGGIAMFCALLFFTVYPLIYYTLIIPKIKKKLGLIKKNWWTASRFFIMRWVLAYIEVATVTARRYVMYKSTGDPDYKRKKGDFNDGFWSQDYPVTLCGKFEIVMSFIVVATCYVGVISGIAGFIFMKLSHAG